MRASDLSGVVVLNTRDFGIPFYVDAADHQPVEVRLFSSNGPGSEWKLLDRNLQR